MDRIASFWKHVARPRNDDAVFPFGLMGKSALGGGCAGSEAIQSAPPVNQGWPANIRSFARKSGLFFSGPLNAPGALDDRATSAARPSRGATQRLRARCVPLDCRLCARRILRAGPARPPIDDGRRPRDECRRSRPRGLRGGDRRTRRWRRRLRLQLVVVRGSAPVALARPMGRDVAPPEPPPAFRP